MLFRSQYHITDAELLVNNGGNNVYSSATFISSTVKDVKALCDNKDANGTKNVYIVNASLSSVAGNYSSKISLVGEDGTVLELYSGSASQYNWILEYTGNVKYEITVNAWNGKFKASILAVILEDGTRVCNPYNFSK
mgnify:CR=1 FL=1